MKTRTVIIGAAVVSAIGLFALQQWRKGALPIVVAAPFRGPLTEHVEARAVTRLSKTHRVTMPQAALVEPRLVEVGAHVKAGDTLAVLDPRPLDLAVAEAAAAMKEQDAILAKSRDNSLESRAQQQAESLVESVADAVEAAAVQVQAGQRRHAFTKAVLRRLEVALQASSVNERERAELDAIEAEVSAMQDRLIANASQAIQAAVILLPKMVGDYIDRKQRDDDVTNARKSAAEARLNQALLNQENAVLGSPIDGLVLEAPIQTPRHLGFGETVFVVGHLDDLQIKTDILSEDAVRMAPGDACVIYGPALAALSGGGLTGIVDRISPNAFKKISSLGVEQQRVEVVIRLNSDALKQARDTHLGVGYQLDVQIITDHRDNALQIPRSALFRNQENLWQVFIVVKGRAELRSVTIGIQDNTHAEVLTGLEEQDEVIVEPASRIQQGTRVRAIIE